MFRRIENIIYSVFVIVKENNSHNMPNQRIIMLLQVRKFDIRMNDSSSFDRDFFDNERLRIGVLAIS